MLLKELLFVLSSVNVVDVYDADFTTKRLDTFIYRWKQAVHIGEYCIEKYGNNPVKAVYVADNKVKIYVKTNENV